MVKIQPVKYLNRLKKLVKVSVEDTFIYPLNIYSHHNLSFSQEGEDRILCRIFEYQNQGFYVDVGAHHPQRFSNTYLFYLRGWKGINIDAMPGSMKQFEELRPEDINVEAAISDSQETLNYYMFDEPALNSFSEKVSVERGEMTNYKIIDKSLIKTRRLSEILDQYLLVDQVIDFLNIDVEGLDYQVLLSNDWSKYKPKVILVEELSSSINSIVSSPTEIGSLLSHQGYELFAKTFNTSFYRLVST
ncbi:FkbM family methyltransferase [Nodosilinea sp. FACHB-131]|uniref:FkbM family methyltransferase n=1 Tax=Cyanophyceae TaxID=3028117 RepID=UPI0016835596|nr:FkbM family methyltransferase [Nodosilinea sp. FACHB-131]MBD1874003.1 FkbM family methyltransferase [Nodosilinea sp. FACHB-131]